jgi:RecA/RadA recombinase
MSDTIISALVDQIETMVKVVDQLAADVPTQYMAGHLSDAAVSLDQAVSSLKRSLDKEQNS